MKVFSLMFGSKDPALEIDKKDDPLEKKAKFNERLSHAISMTAIIIGGLILLTISVWIANQ